VKGCRTCANRDCPFPRDAELREVFNARGWDVTRENMQRLIKEMRCYRPFPLRVRIQNLLTDIEFAWLAVCRAIRSVRWRGEH